MNFYVTFGRRYAREEHPVLPGAHPDGWLLVHADNEEAARRLVVAKLGIRWAFIYGEKTWDAEQFPRGEVGVLDADGLVATPWATVMASKPASGPADDEGLWVRVTGPASKPFVRKYGVYGDTEQVACSSCGYATDSASELVGDRGMPKAGDFGLCLNCGAVEVYTGHSLRRRLPTAAELVEFRADPKSRKAQDIVIKRGTLP